MQSDNIQSSLSPIKVNTLPNVYHRPQEGKGVKNVPYNRDNANGETREHLVPFYENPSRNSMLDFDTHGTDNEYFVRKLVTAYNFEHRRDASEVSRYSKLYLEQFEHFNLCWRCRMPLKTVPVKALISSEAHRDENDKPVAIEGFNYTKPIYRQKVRKRSVSNRYWKHTFETEQYRESRAVTTAIYADVKSHYVVKTTSDGKFYYVYDDGSGRNIQLRYRTKQLRRKKLRFGKMRNVTVNRKISYYVEVIKIDAGIVENEILPHKSYRVFNTKCGCHNR